jgi:hypothetical protein
MKPETPCACPGEAAPDPSRRTVMQFLAAGAVAAAGTGCGIEAFFRKSFKELSRPRCGASWPNWRASTAASTGSL